MASYRCSQCSTNWPQTGDYRKCPDCGIPTWQSQNPSLDEDEAASRVNYLMFEQFAREWEDKRAIEEENAISAKSKTTVRASGDCCLCGLGLHSGCKHPWGKPFDHWPEGLRAQVIEAAPCGFDADPPKK